MSHPSIIGELSFDEQKSIARMRLEQQNQEYKYLHLVEDVLTNGSRKADRTNVGTISIPHATISFDLQKGFPLLTTKKMAWKTLKVELEGFIKGIKSKKWYQERGCHIWDDWCNPQCVPYGRDEITLEKMRQEDDLGEIYGRQWRDFDNQGYDQLRVIVDTLKKNPTDRRMVCSAWNPLALKSQALPPCHYSFVVSVVDDKVNLSFTMRSVDVGLGLGFNIASYALLCHLLAKQSDLQVGTVTGFLNNVHIYDNHIQALQQQLLREPYVWSTIQTNEFATIFDWTADDTQLIGYRSHDSIKMPIAI